MSSLFPLLSFLLRLSANVQHSRLRIFGIAVAGVAGGLATTGMIALINAIITGPQSRNSQRIWGFVALCVALPACRFASQALLVDLSQSSLLTLRLRLSRLVLSAPLRQLEAIGASRLLATLTTDIGTIADSMSMVPLLIMHATLVLSSLLYMGWLDARLLLGACAPEIAGMR